MQNFTDTKIWTGEIYQEFIFHVKALNDLLFMSNQDTQYFSYFQLI